MPDGVVFLPSFHEAIRELPDQERLNAYDAVVNYGLYGEIISMSPTVRMMFSLIKPNIDSSRNRYAAAKENGGKPPRPGSNPRGRPRKNQSNNQSNNQNGNQDIDKDFDSDYDSEKDYDSATETDKRAVSRPPPTKAEVELFLYQNKVYINPDRFYVFCEEIGWEKIWDWRNLAKSWDKNELKRDSNEFYLQWRIRARENGLIKDE